MSAAILFYTVASVFVVFNERNVFWAVFNALDRAARLGFIYFSFFSLIGSAIHFTGWVKSKDSEITDDLPISYIASNSIFILCLCIIGLSTMSYISTIAISLFSFGLAGILTWNLFSKARIRAPLMILAGSICFIASLYFIQYTLTFSNFFSSVVYSSVILILFLSAIKCLKFIRFAWPASAIWLVGLAIFMLINAVVPLALITDQMRLSNDSRFNYRIEIVDRGRSSEHVRLFTHEIDTGKESIIILPELSGSLVLEDGERFGCLIQWEDDKYLLLLDRRLWAGDINWLAINVIDLSTESAVPLSQFESRDNFWLAHNLWTVWGWREVSNHPSFAEVIQVAELIRQLTGHLNIWEYDWLFSDYIHRNDSDLSLKEYVESQLANQRW